MRDPRAHNFSQWTSHERPDGHHYTGQHPQEGPLDKGFLILASFRVGNKLWVRFRVAKFGPKVGSWRISKIDNLIVSATCLVVLFLLHVPYRSITLIFMYYNVSVPMLISLLRRESLRIQKNL